MIRKQLKVTLPMLSKDLQIGLFVSELECGWHGTPFLLEGLFLASEEEIATIRGLTSRVTVDPSRSQVNAFPAAYAAHIYENNAEPRQPVAQIRRQQADLEKDAASEQTTTGLLAQLRQLILDLSGGITSKDAVDKIKPAINNAHPEAAQSTVFSAGAPAEKAEEFPRYLEQIYATAHASQQVAWRDQIAGWFNWLRRQSVDAGPTQLAHASPIARPDYIPEEMDLVIYPDPEATIEGIPTALAACEISQQAMAQIARNVRANGTIDTLLLENIADTLAENMISRPATMMLAARMRDENDRMYQHGLGVAIYLTMLGRHLGFQREPLAELATIGMLLDLGKMDLDQTLLDKPGLLDDHEQKVMETHVEIGVQKLRVGGVRSELVLAAIADHHERIDGRGYPNGRAGENLTIYAKMAAIADGFVAMVGPRPYAPTMSTYDALRSLFAEAGTRWHAPLVEQFVQSIGVFPVGSLVELSTGEIAVVIEDNKFRRLEPKVLILTCESKKQLEQPWEMDIMKHNFSIAPDSLRIVKGLADGAYGVDFREFYLRR